MKKPEVPHGKVAKDWAENEIDHFIASKLEEENLTPSPEADRRTLIRRATLDLTGLPPTVEEVDAFLADEDPNAFEKVVDRLLASNAYGERMAVEWLDAARYADTSGYQYDWFRTMWRWRDWVIDSYNQNQPYDEFITWQLAGDLLPDATLDPENCDWLQSQPPLHDRGRSDPGRVSSQLRVGSRYDHGDRFYGNDFRMRSLSRSQIRSCLTEGFLSVVAFFNHLPEKGQVGGKPLFGPPAIPAPTAEQAAELDQIEKSSPGRRRKTDAARS